MEQFNQQLVRAEVSYRRERRRGFEAWERAEGRTGSAPARGIGRRLRRRRTTNGGSR